MRKIAIVFCLMMCVSIKCSSQVIPTHQQFLSACDSLGISHGEVVWAQARLESGNFRCGVYKTKNNCLGIYDSRRHEYARFSGWVECLEAYRDRVQYKRGGVEESDEEYLKWLVSMGYCSDVSYEGKVLKIMRNP